MALTPREQAKRDKLKNEKPLVYEKILKIPERHSAGIATPIIDIAYSYQCNLSCDHCTAWRGRWMRGPKARKLTPTDLLNLSNQAHDLGLAQFCISGGEPTTFHDIDEVITALQPDKFHIAMSTHGHFLTLDKAKHYKGLGLDKVKISLDDFDPKLHEANRNSEGSYQKAIDAMFNAKEAGLSVVIQTVVTRHTAQTDRIKKMAQFATENDFTVDILCARPTGAWEGRYDMLINEDDEAFLWAAKQEYPVLHRDTWPAYGMQKGSGAVHSTLHVTQYGDIMPCVYIHIGIGNLFTGSLRDAIDLGNQISWFRRHNKLCLSSEDRDFITNYIAKAYDKQLPIPWTEAFSSGDMVDPSSYSDLKTRYEEQQALSPN